MEPIGKVYQKGDAYTFSIEPEQFDRMVKEHLQALLETSEEMLKNETPGSSRYSETLEDIHCLKVVIGSLG